MKLKKYTLLYSLLLLITCSSNHNFEKTGNCKLVANGTFKLLDGYKPFDIIDSNNKVLAVYIKNDSLCFFDIRQKNITKKIGLNFSTENIKAIRVIDNSRILIAEGKLPVSVYSMNFNGQLINRLSFKQINSVKVPPSPALDKSGKYLLDNNTVFMAGVCVGEGEFKNGDRPQGIKYSLGIDKYEYFMDQPGEYYSKNWGGLYYRQPFMTGNGNGEYIFSFPALHDLIVYNSVTEEQKRVCAGSSKIEEIKPFSKSKTNSPSIKDETVKYYFTNPSYSCVAFDKRNNVYYRMADFPNPKFGQATEFNKPHSVIILSNDFKFLGETFLENKNYLQQFYPTSKGLFVPYYDTKKNETYLTLFEISKNE